jgi:hypothetical protein
MQKVAAKSIRKVRNIPRGRIVAFPEIDARLLEWVKARNAKGLRVKDKFIQIQARNIRDQLIAQTPDGPERDRLKTFAASKIYVHRFKSRNKLGSRRHTTTHTLPERFREVAIEFLESVHQKCLDFNIPRDRILNFDQVRDCLISFVI